MPEDHLLERLEKLEGIVETTVRVLPPLVQDLSRRIDGLREEMQGVAARLEARIQQAEAKLEGAKQNLSRCMADRWRRDLTADGSDQDAIEKRVAISHARITGAAALGLALAGWDHFRGRPVNAMTRLPFGALLAGVALILLWLGPDWLEMVR